MKRTDEKGLLEKIKAMAKDDIFIDTMLRMVCMNIRADMIGTSVSQEYIDQVILDDKLRILVSNILDIQCRRIAALENDYKVLTEKYIELEKES